MQLKTIQKTTCNIALKCCTLKIRVEFCFIIRQAKKIVIMLL